MVGDRYAPEYSPLPGSTPAPFARAGKGSGLAMNSDLTGPGRIILSLRVRDKTHLLRELAHRAAVFLALDEEAIYRALQGREQLGSTGVGRGIALPHAPMNGIKNLFGMFVRLSRPIDFGSIDEKPVDLVFLLLAPLNAGNEHVAALAAVSRRLRDTAFNDRLRKAENTAAVQQLFTDNSGSIIACGSRIPVASRDDAHE
jgi:nitrogen PTS system EIIA component